MLRLGGTALTRGGLPHARASFGALLVASCCALLGCRRQRTEIVVVADTDLRVPGQIDEIRVTVQGPTEASAPSVLSLVPPTARPLPATLGVEPATDAVDWITVTASGYKDHAATPVVTRSARVRFVRNERRTLRLDLLARCLAVVCEDPSESCDESGACAPRERSPDALPPWREGVDPARLDGGAAVDAGVPDYPGPTTTGPRGALTPVVGDMEVRTNGAVIENLDVRTSGIYVAATNVTFRNVRVTYTGAVDQGFALFNLTDAARGVVFEDCEIDGRSGIQRAIKGIAGVTVRRCDIHDVGVAVDVGRELTVEDSYLHEIALPAGLAWSVSGVQSGSSTQDVLVRHNTIELPGDGAGCVNVQGASDDTISDVLVENNLLGGGTYTVYAGAGHVSNVRVVANRFTHRFAPTVGRRGIWYPGADAVVRSGNVIHETGAPADRDP